MYIIWYYNKRKFVLKFICMEVVEEICSWININVFFIVDILLFFYVIFYVYFVGFGWFGVWVWFVGLECVFVVFL